MLTAVGDESVLPRFERLAELDVREKAPGDLVTVADIEAEGQITAVLSTWFPEATIIGEEAVVNNPALLGRIDTDPQVWLIDPIDGTSNFVAGNPDFGMMLCELRRGQPVRSWIWQPLHREMFYSEHNGGAWRNGIPIVRRPPDADHLSGASCAYYLSEGSALRSYARSMTGSCSLDYPQIATGQSDFLIHNGRHPWDHYPGLLMLQEVNGVVKFADGETFSSSPASPYRLVAAANEEVWMIVAETMKTLPLPPVESLQ